MDTMDNCSRIFLHFLWGTRGGCQSKLVGRPKDMEHKKDHVGEESTHNIKNITIHTKIHINTYG